MDTEILFEEIQEFKVIQIVFKVLTTIFFAASLTPFIFNIEDRVQTSIVFLGIAVSFATVHLFFNRLKLVTQIKPDGVYANFLPFRNSSAICIWENIDQIFIRTYNPVGEFGGWGRRIGRNNNKAFNISGNMGLQIVFKDGSRFLIGTNKPNEMGKVLMKLGKLDFPDKEL